MEELSQQLGDVKLSSSNPTCVNNNRPQANKRSQHRRIQGPGWSNGQVKKPHNRNSNNSDGPAFQPTFKQPTVERDAAKKSNIINDPSCPVKMFHEEKLAPVRGPNTESFTPSHEPAQIRVVCAPFHLKTYDKFHTPRDVVVVQNLFEMENFSIYENLKNEIAANVPDDVWVPWHGDSHLIANDKLNWKKYCPTFNMVLEKLCEYFKMEAKATRLNWYRDNSEWKPYHHDAAAVNADKAQTQNITVAASFGAEREVAFEHAKTKTTISIPLVNGSVYSFGKDVNILWRHGIPQLPPNALADERGRFSVIVWGWTHLGELSGNFL
ncbi:uncharacterized protein LOC142346281 isoform X2 [Convolutriloba macropyga]|uniref:uncharacterized protein LOC142346281 isoform X2 n=1 Tax=Convolutriloba macropyga TaxID=536237 RepID=UPI003F51CE6F